MKWIGATTIIVKEKLLLNGSHNTNEKLLSPYLSADILLHKRNYPVNKSLFAFTKKKFPSEGGAQANIAIPAKDEENKICDLLNFT